MTLNLPSSRIVTVIRSVAAIAPPAPGNRQPDSLRGPKADISI
jgi:hypothetical protein